jgi:hypothetical protein
MLTRTNLLNWWQMRPIGWSGWRESSVDCRVWQTIKPFVTRRYACVTHLGERGTPETVGTHANYKSLFTSSSQNPRG